MAPDEARSEQQNHSSKSREVAAASIRLALTQNRREEKQLIAELSQNGISGAAVDFGGEFITSVSRIIERAVVAARREGIIHSSHAEEGAVAGAAHEAVSQLITKATGLNIGGKIGIARWDDHVSVSAFFGIGLLHLDEVAIGMGHRVI